VPKSSWLGGHQSSVKPRYVEGRTVTGEEVLMKTEMFAGDADAKLANKAPHRITAAICVTLIDET